MEGGGYGLNEILSYNGLEWLTETMQYPKEESQSPAKFRTQYGFPTHLFLIPFNLCMEMILF